MRLFLSLLALGGMVDAVHLAVDRQSWARFWASIGIRLRDDQTFALAGAGAQFLLSLMFLIYVRRDR